MKKFFLMPIMAVALLFYSCSKEEIVTENGHSVVNGHIAVDLGLPSGTLWADYNIGTSNPIEFGKYFAWGECVEKDAYDWNTYKWCNKSYNTLTKYCTENIYGKTDNKIILESNDDAATILLGSPWSTPTKEDFIELMNECKWYWSFLLGVDGYLVIGRNDNCIFLPAAGCRFSVEYCGKGERGYYWSSSLDEIDPYDAYYLAFSPTAYLESNSFHLASSYDRNHGMSIRAVIHK